ncbi:Uncharacterised protein [Serratia ficaria]|nr:Uncharacterised protein [Serratia ficaria]CAI1662024.1 Uncharacterised protein [Serratia ficaria]
MPLDAQIARLLFAHACMPMRGLTPATHRLFEPAG